MAKTIVIFSTKGGVGKTLIAANLAVSLARDQGKRVCLLDFDLQGVGDMARMLGLNPDKAIVDMLSSFKNQPNDFKKEYFLTRSPFKIDFMPAVLKPQQLPHLNPAGIKELFSLLDKDYDYIVIDTGKSFSDVFMSILNQANLIF